MPINDGQSFNFIDLFSGIGGFHQAMVQLGGNCVFASEIDEAAIETYRQNYGIDAAINIRDIIDPLNQIPTHSVLCAGFPCQAFSKAGPQTGFADETKGTLFFEIERILSAHHTPYIILENVRNLVSHDNGRTWATISLHLKNAGYRLTPQPLIISPHFFGIPQLRERVVILGKYDPQNVDIPLKINVAAEYSKSENSIYDILEDEPVDQEYYISHDEEKLLTMWDEFYSGIKEDVIGFPIWYDWFRKEPTKDMPAWKKEFIRKNNFLFNNNKDFICKWEKKYNKLKDCTPTQRKFEWQCGTNIKSVWEGVIQIRPSGVRVKIPTCFPALVAIVQIPIIGPRHRRLTVREAARLQNFPEDFIPNENAAQAYKQFGNAVNVEVIRRAAEQLIRVY